MNYIFNHRIESISRTQQKPCSQMNCLFGAQCRQTAAGAQCVCDADCDRNALGTAGGGSGSTQRQRSRIMANYQRPNIVSYLRAKSQRTTNFEPHHGEVCGSDHNTYASECHLKLYACRIQESLIAVTPGPCKKRK